MKTAFTILHAVIFVVLAVIHIRIWACNGFRFPRYVHVMAILATVVGFAMMRIVPADAPILRDGAWGVALGVLMFPTVAYATALLYGGVPDLRDEPEKPERD